MSTEMTYEAAIIELNRLKSQERMDIDRERMIAAVDTLIKEARYRVKRKVDIDHYMYKCPSCGYLIGYDNDRRKLIYWDLHYCKTCGQALDWDF